MATFVDGRLMPSLTMRGRYLMREYWSDSDLFLRLTAEQREVYVGLWMLADDEGWLPRDVPAIAAAIYHYQDRAPREAGVRSALERLRELGKVTSYRCCLYLAAVARYPRAGKKSSEHAQEHTRHSYGVKPIQTDSKPSPVPSRRDPSPPDVAGADARNGAAPREDPQEGETESDFRKRTGLPTFLEAVR